MRAISKPSTAKCNDDIYVSYLLSDPNYTSCTRLSEVMESVSHDSVNRFLERERFSPKDLFDEEKDKIELSGGILSVDDSVLDKPYSDPKKAAFIDYYWSGKHKAAVKGINLVSLFYTDIHGVCVPVNYRICDKSEKKTKNDYFQEMLLEVLEWGLLPTYVTGDCWYSSLMNLKKIRKHNINFMFGVESNRLVSITRGEYIQVQTLEDWPSDGKRVYLKEYGQVKVFRRSYKNVYRYYLVSTSNLDNLDGIAQSEFESVHSSHWSIEQFHRAIKQVCNVERFQVRREHPIRNHIFCALKAFVRLEFMRFDQLIPHWYDVRKNLFIATIRSFIKNTALEVQPVNA